MVLHNVGIHTFPSKGTQCFTMTKPQWLTHAVEKMPTLAPHWSESPWAIPVAVRVQWSHHTRRVMDLVYNLTHSSMYSCTPFTMSVFPTHITHEGLIGVSDIGQVFLFCPDWFHLLFYCFLCGYHVRGDHLRPQILQEGPIPYWRLILYSVWSPGRCRLQTCSWWLWYQACPPTHLHWAVTKSPPNGVLTTARWRT